MLTDYGSTLQYISKRKAAGEFPFAHVMPVLAALAARRDPPPVTAWHAREMRCALPTCARTRRRAGNETTDAVSGDRSEVSSAAAAPATPAAAAAAAADKPLLRCEQCKIARYCSAAHQRAHWPAHRALCKREAEERRLLAAELAPLAARNPRSAAARGLRAFGKRE